MNAIFIFIGILSGIFSFLIFADDVKPVGYTCLCVSTIMLSWLIFAFVNIEPTIHYAEVLEIVTTNGIKMQGYIPYIGEDSSLGFRQLDHHYENIKSKVVVIKNYNGWTYAMHFIDMSDDVKILDSKDVTMEK